MGGFHLATKLRCRVVGRLKGLSRQDILTVIDGISDADDFDGYCKAYVATGGRMPDMNEALVGGPIGDFFKRAIEWLMSEEGQQFIKFLFSLFGLLI